MLALRFFSCTTYISRANFLEIFSIIYTANFEILDILYKKMMIFGSFFTVVFNSCLKMK